MVCNSVFNYFNFQDYNQDFELAYEYIDFLKQDVLVGLALSIK